MLSTNVAEPDDNHAFTLLGAARELLQVLPQVRRALLLSLWQQPAAAEPSHRSSLPCGLLQRQGRGAHRMAPCS